MRQRCENPNDRAYSWYGARGITVCKQWKLFRNFYADMGDTYESGLWLDRINNDEGYCKENCRWVTPLVQANNTRKTRLITFEGETLSVSAWARKLNIKRKTLSQRLNAYNFSIEKALTI